MAVYRPTPVCANCKTPFKGVYKEADNFCGDLFIKWEKQCVCKFTIKLNINPPEESKTALEILESLKDTYYDEYLQCKTVPISTAVQAMEIYGQQQLEQSKITPTTLRREVDYIESIKINLDPQFIFDYHLQQVNCRCGQKAIFWKTGYLCGTFTAYPCKYNKI